MTEIAAHTVLYVFGLLLLASSGLTVVRPSMAKRFIRAFAQSARLHYTEQAARLVIGVSLVVSASDMWMPTLFRVIGWVVVGSAALLIVLPWQWHRRFAELVIPILVRYLVPYGMGLLSFGAFLLYGLLRGGGVLP